MGGSTPSVPLEQTNFLLLEKMGSTEVCRENPEERPCSTDNRNRDHCAKSRGSGHLSMRGELRIKGYVTNDYGFLEPHRAATGGFILTSYRREMIEEIQSETALGHNRKCACVPVE